MKKSKRFSLILFTYILPVLLLNIAGCGRRVISEQNKMEPVTGVRKLEASRIPSYVPERLKINADQSSRQKLPPEIAADQKKSDMAIGFGLENPVSMDLGIYGKSGTATFFVASRQLIGTYDRLYWVMVRVLSEKYGCFIKRKISGEHTVRFECRDHRTVVMERDISGDFSKFSGRQFDLQGREIIVKQRPIAFKSVSR